MEYNQNGNYLALAGLIAVVLSKFNVNTDQATVMAVIGGILGFLGIVKQFMDHKKLAISAGAFPKS